MQWLGRRIRVIAQDLSKREREQVNKNEALGHSGLLPKSGWPGPLRYRDDSEVNAWCRMTVIRNRAPPYYSKTNKLATFAEQILPRNVCFPTKQ